MYPRLRDGVMYMETGGHTSCNCGRGRVYSLISQGSLRASSQCTLVDSWAFGEMATLAHPRGLSVQTASAVTPSIPVAAEVNW